MNNIFENFILDACYAAKKKNPISCIFEKHKFKVMITDS